MKIKLIALMCCVLMVCSFAVLGCGSKEVVVEGQGEVSEEAKEMQQQMQEQMKEMQEKALENAPQAPAEGSE